MYHFLCGYTAKIAGTEAGITEPKVTFSACFGAPFLPLHPHTYARLLGERIRRKGVKTWLVNTGWIEGSYGKGRRMPLEWTRALIHAALNGALDEVAYRTNNIFNLAIPVSCPGLPDSVLDPRATWKDKDEYDRVAEKLHTLFEIQFSKFEKSSAASPRTVFRVELASL